MEQTTTDVAAVSATKVHPLLRKKIIGIGDWEEWLTRWEATAVAEELIGLLHVGCDTGGYIEHDFHKKIAFYLSVARGHTTPSSWHDRDDDEVLTAIISREHNDCLYTQAELRTIIAAKAWGVLCTKFFGPWRDKKAAFQDRWSTPQHLRKGDLELMGELIDFFDTEDGTSNFPKGDGHYRTVCEDFLVWFIQAAWRGWVPRSIDVVSPASDPSLQDAITNYCIEARPRLVNILYHMGKLEMLQTLAYDERTIPQLELIVWEHAQHAQMGWPIEKYAAKGFYPAQLALLLRNQYAMT